MLGAYTLYDKGRRIHTRELRSIKDGSPIYGDNRIRVLVTNVILQCSCKDPIMARRQRLIDGVVRAIRSNRKQIQARFRYQCGTDTSFELWEISRKETTIP